ncbi:hypothetical protein P280DRAFT_118371 [Massarina eburnea CBS 473.64]|uniref:Uncharacterized protein n=1 Tax=Massarina eburnea CBS 473.64 TaxID=1395130 RepID=A0A6A6SBY8_9PLEO|nr:hypothetical protein P280DRAFT_118371 [Massarina eburnea CBS 473.64]
MRLAPEPNSQTSRLDFFQTSVPNIRRCAPLPTACLSCLSPAWSMVGCAYPFPSRACLAYLSPLHISGVPALAASFLSSHQHHC